MNCYRLLPSFVLVLALVAGQLHADERLFKLDWSGAIFGNSATATGLLTLDDALLPNPQEGFDTSGWGTYFTDFEMTIQGATSGNGTFGFSDFNQAVWDTNGGTLDLSMELIGQATLDDGWGTVSNSNAGDFNLFNATASAPTGTINFELTTNAGAGDPMLLTGFVAVPEPGSLMFLGPIFLAGVLRRRR